MHAMFQEEQFIGWMQCDGGAWQPVVSAAEREECSRQLGVFTVPPRTKHVTRMTLPAGEQPKQRRFSLPRK